MSQNPPQPKFCLLEEWKWVAGATAPNVVSFPDRPVWENRLHVSSFYVASAWESKQQRGLVKPLELCDVVLEILALEFVRLS
ncbi:hypothetical protein TNCT_206101 [Trichonephila clavata]|uniref:Uncharacterized protein n=1 Tax=Trichonephila clavata TaxID=2740835 RepID=A0A8X6J7C3_TRICU|nr:hypothetical protein TNCT_206101 [Trichonephila clavata]